jgi:hypothetical protein
MSYAATSEDWYDLLGLTSVLPAVFRGEATVAATRGALLQARERWPGTNADYVAIIDGFNSALLDVDEAIFEQQRSLSALRKSITDIEESVPEDFPGGTIISTPPDPVDRLLTAGEQDLLTRISQQLEELAEEIEGWSDKLEDDADEAEDAAADAEREAEEEEEED